MTPIQKAAEIYERYKITPDFMTDMAEHFETGAVVSTPMSFVMAKALQLADGKQCWFITVAAGSLRAILQFMPFKMPYIAFYRRGKGELKVYETDKLMKRAARLC